MGEDLCAVRRDGATGYRSRRSDRAACSGILTPRVMRTTHILFTVGIVFLFSGCAGRPNGAVVTPEPPQTTITAEPTAGVNPTVQFDTLPECEGGPNRVEGPPPGPPNGQPVCRAKPPLTVQAAKIVGVTIFPAVSEIKVGDTAEFQMHIQLSPPNGIPPKIIPPLRGETYTSWATDNPAVAAVITSTIGGEPRGGTLTARAPGEVTLSGRWGEHIATRMLRIVR